MEYCPTLDHLHANLLLPSSQFKFDGSRLAAVTTWMPGKISDSIEFELPGELPDENGKIDFVFDGAVWDMKGASEVHIGVYDARSSSDQPLDFTLQLREYRSEPFSDYHTMTEQTFSAEVSEIFDVYNRVKVSCEKARQVN